MKKVLTPIALGFGIYFLFRILGNEFIYGWIAGIIATLIVNLIYDLNRKQNDNNRNS